MTLQSLLHISSEEALAITSTWRALLVCLDNHPCPPDTSGALQGLGIRGNKLKNCCWKRKRVMTLGNRERRWRPARLSVRKGPVCSRPWAQSPRPRPLAALGNKGTQINRWSSYFLGFGPLVPGPQHRAAAGGESLRCHRRGQKIKEGEASLGLDLGRSRSAKAWPEGDVKLWLPRLPTGQDKAGNAVRLG